MHTSSSANDVFEEYKELSILESAAGVLQWDMETMMPPGSAPLRGEQLAVLAKIMHAKQTAPSFVEKVMKLDSKLSPQNERLQIQVLKQQALTSSLVERLQKLQVECQELWKQARKESKYSLVENKLSELLAAQREWAESLKNSSGILKSYYKDFSLYEICLDQFEPGMKADTIRQHLSYLGEQLREILPTAQEKSKSRGAVDAALLKMELPVQVQLNTQIAKALGYDFNCGRLDTSTHPFCGGSPGDTRITTRYDLADFVDSLSSVMHETGHAIYEQNLPQELLHTPCGKAASFGIHESQSRLHENQVARSLPFCEFLNTLLHSVSAEDLYRHMIRVERGYIRVDADEVSYNLHIILRTKLEEQMINGVLSVKDLPGAWNAEFKRLFGFEVPSDRDGCLQDTHWYGGGFGYFPTYTIGNILSAQLFARFTQENLNYRDEIRRGEFSTLRAYLNKTVHAQAALKDSPETIRQSLGGQDLDPRIFVEYIRKKYT